MRIVLLGCLVLLFACGMKAHNPVQGGVQLDDCQRRWKIFEPSKKMTGTAVFYAPSLSCGILTGGAIALIQTSNGDTFRVIDYCNQDTTILVGSTVVIVPQKNTTIPIVATDPQRCSLLETLFGRVRRVK